MVESLAGNTLARKHAMLASPAAKRKGRIARKSGLSQQRPARLACLRAGVLRVSDYFFTWIGRVSTPLEASWSCALCKVLTLL